MNMYDISNNQININHMITLIDTILVLVTIIICLIIFIAYGYYLGYVSFKTHKLETAVDKEIELEKAIKNIEKKYNSNVLIILSDNKFEQAPENKNIINIDDEDAFYKYMSGKEDSKKLLQIVMHVIGGDVDVSDTMYNVLLRYKGKINVYIPYYNCSAGNMITFVADEIYMNKFSYVTPVDPQFEKDDFSYSGKSFINAYKKRKAELEGEWLVMYEEANLLHKDTVNNTRYILEQKKTYREDKLDEIIRIFTSGRYVHHKQIFREELSGLMTNIMYEIPKELTELIYKFIL